MNKGDILGAIQPVQATGDHVFDEARLNESLSEDSSILLFCRGCGEVYMISRLGLQNLRRIAKISDGEDISHEKGMYFEAEGCEGCTGDAASLILRSRHTR